MVEHAYDENVSSVEELKAGCRTHNSSFTMKSTDNTMTKIFPEYFFKIVDYPSLKLPHMMHIITGEMERMSLFKL